MQNTIYANPQCLVLSSINHHIRKDEKNIFMRGNWSDSQWNQDKRCSSINQEDVAHP